MDPYLEHPEVWPGVHLGLITYSREALNAILPSGYVADMGERLYVAEPVRDIYPDVAVTGRARPASNGPRGGATAVLDGSAAPWVLSVDPREFREPFIRILSPRPDRRVVTVIELLSPANKASGSKGRRLYQAKQRELLRSHSSLLEIDLLRAGVHTVAAPLEPLRRRGTWDYLACLHRGGHKGEYEVWPVLLRERLPLVRVPLSESDPDVELDLQAVFDRCYDSGRYRDNADYGQEPAPPLMEEDAAWAKTLLPECRESPHGG
jgi:hypothetical protein